jgi:ankyrin repeat protein
VLRQFGSRLHEARKEEVELLLANKADVNAKNTAGNTPLQVASSDDTDVVALLRKHGGHK